MKNLIYLLLTLSLLQSCRKESTSKDNSVTITGKIVKDCEGTPFANQKFQLYAGENFFNPGEFYSFETDSKGNFSITNPEARYGQEYTIMFYNGMDILVFTTSNDLNIGTLNTSPTANYQIKIKINNPYNVGDTLSILSHNGGGAIHTLIAPFKDTTFSAYYNYQNPLEVPRIKSKNKVLIEPDYTIYRYDGATYVEHITKRCDTYLEGCQSGVQEVTITID